MVGELVGRHLGALFEGCIHVLLLITRMFYLVCRMAVRFYVPLMRQMITIFPYGTGREMKKVIVLLKQKYEKSVLLPCPYFSIFLRVHFVLM